MQAHRAAAVAGAARGRGRRAAVAAVARAVAVERDHHALRIGHPHQALEQPDRAAEAAEQVAREGELGREHQRADAEEARLAGRQRAAEQAAPQLGRRQQVAQQRDRPQEARHHAGQREHRPPAPLRRTVGARRRVAVPQAEARAGAVQQVVDQLDQREVRAQPAAVEPTPSPGHREEQRHQHERRQEGAAQDGQRGGGGVDAPGHEVVDPQRPAPAEEPQLRLVQVEAQPVQGRRDQEEHEERGLKETAAALHERDGWLNPGATGHAARTVLAEQAAVRKTGIGVDATLSGRCRPGPAPRRPARPARPPSRRRR